MSSGPEELRRTGRHRPSISSLVIPPIRKSATSAGARLRRPFAAAVRARYWPTWRSLRTRSRIQSLPSGSPSVRQQLLGVEDLDAALAHHLDEGLVLHLRPRTQITSSNSSSSAFAGVSRRCSRPGPVDDHLAQLADLGVDAESHCDPFPSATRTRRARWKATQMSTNRSPSRAARSAGSGRSRSSTSARPPMTTAEVGVIRLTRPEADWYAVTDERAGDVGEIGQRCEDRHDERRVTGRRRHQEGDRHVHQQATEAKIRRSCRSPRSRSSAGSCR